MEKIYYVYIMTNERNTTLYTGVSGDLIKRMYEHANSINKGSFTSKYNISKLVYFEQFTDVEKAILREKQIKAGSRKKKIEMIERVNQDWNDLTSQINGY